MWCRRQKLRVKCRVARSGTYFATVQDYDVISTQGPDFWFFDGDGESWDNDFGSILATGGADMISTELVFVLDAFPVPVKIAFMAGDIPYIIVLSLLDVETGGVLFATSGVDGLILLTDLRIEAPYLGAIPDPTLDGQQDGNGTFWFLTL